RSFIVIATVVLCLTFLPNLQVADPDPRNERIILVIFGGLLAGVAKAIAFQRRGSTGDEDLVGAFIAMKYLKPVGSIAIIAGVISTTFGLTLDFIKYNKLESVINTLMYTSVYIFVSAEILNNFYRKFKLSMIIAFSKKPKEVGD